MLDFLDGLGLGALPVVGNSMGGTSRPGSRPSTRSGSAGWLCIGGVGLSLLSPSPPEGIKLLVEFVENPTRERLVKWMESMVYDTAILTDEFVQMRWESATDPDGPPTSRSCTTGRCSRGCARAARSAPSTRSRR